MLYERELASRGNCLNFKPDKHAEARPLKQAQLQAATGVALTRSDSQDNDWFRNK